MAAMFANTQMMGLGIGGPDVQLTPPTTNPTAPSTTFPRMPGMPFMPGFPDVCVTPSPGGPVPIPYPNVAAGSGGGDFDPMGTIGAIGGAIGGALGGMNPLSFLSMLGGGEPETPAGCTQIVPSQAKILTLSP